MFKTFYGQEESYFTEKNCGHTAKEIAHQPAMWRALVGVLQENKSKINDFISSIGSLNNKRIILTGAGSSGFVGRGVAGFAAKSGVLCEAVHTTDIVSAPETYLFADIPTVLISFARSGNSPESEGAVRYARKVVKDLYEIAIVCDGESKLSKTTAESEKGLLLVMPEGTNDKGFAMTSSVSCMMLAGLALFNGNKMDELTADITALANYVEENGRRFSDAALTCANWNYDRAWFMGCGPLAAVCQEGALKLMELTNGAVVAGNNASTEFRHGPKTVMSPTTLTLHFVSNKPFTAKYDIDLINELYQEKGTNRIAVLHDESINSVNADLAIPYSSKGYGVGEDIAGALQGLLFMQLMAMHTSLKLGIGTDNPSPSGSVNRVVKGVTVYPL